MRRLGPVAICCWLALAAGLRAPAVRADLLAHGGIRPAIVGRSATVQLAAPIGEDEAHTASPGMPQPANGEERKRGFLGRFSRRVKEKELPAVEEVDLSAFSKDVDAAIARRRRRLTAKLGSSLKDFREEVLDEYEVQAQSAKVRQNRLRSRADQIKVSLGDLKEDLLDEVTAGVEDGLRGVKRGGQTLERALRQLRTDWEDEVNALVNEARADVDIAVADMEAVIEDQKEEWRESISRFDALYLSQGKRPRYNASASPGEIAALPASLARVLPREELDLRLSELQDSIRVISEEVCGRMRTLGWAPARLSWLADPLAHLTTPAFSSRAAGRG